MALKGPVTARIRAQRQSALTEIELAVPADYTFAAGQYLSVLHPSGVEVPMSIASAPQRLPVLELHYRATPGDALSQAMDECLELPELTISQAQGNVRCPASDQSLLLIVGGSGASLAFAMSQDRANSNAKGETGVLWCADQSDQIYRQQELAEIADALYVEVDDRRTAENEGLVRLRSLKPFDQYVLSGSPEFVWTVVDELQALGLSQQQMQSDIFDYAPRS